MIGCTLYKAKLKRANLEKANLSESNILDCDLRRATFKDTKFDSVELSGGIFCEGVREKIEAKEFSTKEIESEPTENPVESELSKEESVEALDTHSKEGHTFDETDNEHSPPDEILIL